MIWKAETITCHNSIYIGGLNIPSAHFVHWTSGCSTAIIVWPEADLQILMLYVRQSVSLPCLPLPDLCSAKFFFATISTSPDFYFVYFYKSDISLHIYHKTIPWLTHYWLPTSPDCLPATGHCTVWYLLWHAAIQTFWSVFNIQYFNIKPSPGDTLRYFHRYLGQLSAIMLPSDHFPYLPLLMTGGRAGRRGARFQCAR